MNRKYKAICDIECRGFYDIKSGDILELIKVEKYDWSASAIMHREEKYLDKGFVKIEANIECLGTVLELI